MDRARMLESLVRASSDFESLCPAQFGIFCFRARPATLPEKDSTTLNERINARVVSEGAISSRRRGCAANSRLRMCTLGFRTTRDDIRGLFASIERALAVELKHARS